MVGHEIRGTGFGPLQLSEQMLVFPPSEMRGIGRRVMGSAYILKGSPRHCLEESEE